MNATRQFWALFKFQAFVNPANFILIFIFAIPILVELTSGQRTFHTSLEFALPYQNLYFILFWGPMLLLPETFTWGNAGTNAISDFILTRAVDRRQVIRSRVALLYAFILIVPVGTLLAGLVSPSLILDEFENKHLAILANVPGSFAVKTNDYGAATLNLPHGHVQVAAWHVAIIALSAMALQATLFFLQPFKRRLIFFAAIAAGAVVYPLYSLGDSMKNLTPTSDELGFFFMVNHAWAFWVVLIALFLGLQFWCERRFARMEF